MVRLGLLRIASSQTWLPWRPPTTLFAWIRRFLRIKRRPAKVATQTRTTPVKKMTTTASDCQGMHVETGEGNASYDGFSHVQRRRHLPRSVHPRAQSLDSVWTEAPGFEGPRSGSYSTASPGEGAGAGSRSRRRLQVVSETELQRPVHARCTESEPQQSGILLSSITTAVALVVSNVFMVH